MILSYMICIRYGSGFGITSILFGKKSMMNQSNGILGMIFYSLQIIFGKKSNKFFIDLLFFFLISPGLITIPLFSKLALFSSVLACIGSLYLAFILAFVLKDLCLVCIATYIINAGLLWSNFRTVYSSR